MKVGARNQIVGTVKDIKKGQLMCLVKMDVPGPLALSSVMTIDSLDDMGLKKGDRVQVFVKAVHVLLAKE